MNKSRNANEHFLPSYLLGPNANTIENGVPCATFKVASIICAVSASIFILGGVTYFVLKIFT